MKQSCHELTLTNALSDPMVRTVMAADHVDPQEFAAMLAAVAQTIKPSSRRLSDRLGRFICAN
jgi:hypothetical protein